MSKIVDCLVCKFEGSNESGNDKILYVLYDTKREKYILRGLCDTSGTLSFECLVPLEAHNEDIYTLQLFISLFFKGYNLKIYLLNYRTLPYDPNNITFHFLDKFKFKNISENINENIGAENYNIVNSLKMIKIVTNVY